jgi:hypothetical protein
MRRSRPCRSRWHRVGLGGRRQEVARRALVSFASWRRRPSPNFVIVFSTRMGGRACRDARCHPAAGRRRGAPRLAHNGIRGAVRAGSNLRCTGEGRRAWARRRTRRRGGRCRRRWDRRGRRRPDPKRSSYRGYSQCSALRLPWRPIQVRRRRRVFRRLRSTRRTPL